MKFFIVNVKGFVYPIEYKTWEGASANCDGGELVIMAESIAELEFCLDQWEDEYCYG